LQQLIYDKDEQIHLDRRTREDEHCVTSHW